MPASGPGEGVARPLDPPEGCLASPPVPQRGTAYADVVGTTWGKRSSQERAACVVYWIVALAAAAAIRYWNRHQWFFLDEWESLAGRQLRADDLLRPHNEHWSTIPIAAYRTVWSVVGLHHYWPYQMVTIGFHVLGAAMVRIIALRSGADPWLAAAAGMVLLWFGAGRDAFAWGINGFALALALGLTAIVLSDRSSGSPAEDALAGLVCALSLMCSGIGVGFILGVAVVALLRRGWSSSIRVAALPLAAQVFWQVVYGVRPSPKRPTVRQAWEFTSDVASDLATTLGGVMWVGIVTLALAVLGIVVGSRRPGSLPWKDLSSALGALVTAAVSLALLSIGRAAFSGEAAGRYLYLLAALLLPVLAVGLTKITRGHTWRIAATAVLLCVGIPSNALDLRPMGVDRFTLGSSDVVVGYATAPSLRSAPGDLRPFGPKAHQVTVAWLRSAVEAGRVPAPGPRDRAKWPEAELVYALPPVEGGGAVTDCRTLRVDETVRLRPHDVVLVDGDQAHVSLVDASSTIAATIQRPTDPDGLITAGDVVTLEVHGPVGPVRIRSDRPGGSVRLCAAG